MRKTLAIGIACCLVAGALFFMFGRSSSSHVSQPAAGTSTLRFAKQPTVHVGTGPEFDPVNRWFSAVVSQPFDKDMFLGAFDLSAQSCGLDALVQSTHVPNATGMDDSVKDLHATLTHTSAAEATISIQNGTITFVVRETQGAWLIERVELQSEPDGFTGNACDMFTVLVGARGRAEDRAAQSDLRNAMTTEKTIYVDQQRYADDVATLKPVESSLDWQGKTKAYVADGGQVVCVDEVSESGTLWSIADVASGPRVGTYFGKVACPTPLSADAVSMFGRSWDDAASTEKSPRAAESDLRNALTAEKVSYTDNQEYTGDVASLKQIESSLDWGGALKVSVTPDKQGVCVSENALSIADVAIGPFAGTYYGHADCATPFDLAALGTYKRSW